MFQNFRLAMAWVHTWFGLVLGFVLMFAFFFGALAVFDREIDRWAIPETRFEPQPMPSFDRVLMPIFQSMPPDKESLEYMRDRVNGSLPVRFDAVNYWQVFTTHRDPVLGLYAGYEVPNAKEPGELVYAGRAMDPRTGRIFSLDRLAVGSGFFYPLHFNLTLEWKELGAWIVGLAALVMLAALVSGVVMHRKIFREFFTFRPGKNLQRSTLDLHNLTGVVALPFHFFFAFTGLVIFAGIYFPVSHSQLEPLHELHEKLEERETGLPQKRAGVAAPLASVDAMVAEAKRRWAARGMPAEVGSLTLLHVGDVNGYVSIHPVSGDRFPSSEGGVKFRASTGEVLHEDKPFAAVGMISGYLAALHLVPFQHWLLRWLYVVGGLVGCVCIATGFIFFVEKRKKQHAKEGSQGSRVVDALAVTTVTGMLVATLGILIVNRLLPEAWPGDWPNRGVVERCSFWGTWIVAMAHAFWRSAPVKNGNSNPAWREQCVAIAAMSVLAVGLNWVTTGDHLSKTLAERYWPVAGMDLFLLASAVLAVVAARKLKKRSQAPIPGQHAERAHA